jgi:hypothetical protein
LDEWDEETMMAKQAAVVRAPKRASKVFATPSEFVALPPVPAGATPESIYRWEGEHIWRLKVLRKHYAYRSLPGVEGWVPVDGSHATTTGTELLTLDQLREMGVPLPPGGTYADVYQVRGERALRASTLAGDFFCTGPKTGWFDATPRYDNQEVAKATSDGAIMSLPIMDFERPDSECSVRIQRIRQSIRDQLARQRGLVPPNIPRGDGFPIPPKGGDDDGPMPANIPDYGPDGPPGK